MPLDPVGHFAVFIVDFLLLSDSFFIEMNLMEGVGSGQLSILFLVDFVKEVLIFELNDVLFLMGFLLIRPLTRSIEKVHIVVRRLIKMMFFINNGLNTAKVG